MPSSVRLPAGDAAAHPPRFVTIKNWCQMCGISEITGYRMLRKGQGPKVTQLSPGRIAIRWDHLHQWLEAQVRSEK